MTPSVPATIETSADESDAPVAAERLPGLDPLGGIDAWDGCKRVLGALLRDPNVDSDWIARLADSESRARTLAKRDPDLALYLLLQTAAHEVDRYSTHHVLLCAVICELCAQQLGWPDGECDTLVRAALTMNLSMAGTQDALARQTGPLSPAQRQEIGSHAERSAELLQAAGVGDALWLDVVRQHHAVRQDLPEADAAGRLADLLRRVDVYTAKLSRRASRDPVSPAIAARDVCMSADGQPDQVGATLLRVLGLYPPGSFVLLKNGEIGVVVKRGGKAHTPIVALLRRADGGLYAPPVRRDTATSTASVLRGVRLAEVKVRMNHERVLASV
jgi:hypothetical protein